MAEQKLNQVKSRKINFYKFVGKIDSKKGVFTSIGDGKVTEALNNLGSTVNGIARVLDEYVQLSAKNFLAQQKLTKTRSKAEAPKKSGGKLGFTSGIVGSFGKIISTAAGGILGLFGNLFKLFIVLPILDWIRKPENQEKLKNIVAGLAEVGKFLFELVSGAVYTTLEVVAGFTKLPFWKEILKFGLFLAALGTSFLAFKKLFGGKAVKTVVKTIFKLFVGFFKALTKFSIGLARRVAKSRLPGRGGKLGGWKGALLTTGAAVATSVAIDAVIDSQTGKSLDESEKELTELEGQDEKDSKQDLEKFQRSLDDAVKKTEVKADSPAKDKAIPSPIGGVQPAPGRQAPTPAGSPQPATTPAAPPPAIQAATNGSAGILPNSAPAAPDLPPPQMAKGGPVQAPKPQPATNPFPAKQFPAKQFVGNQFADTTSKFKPISDIGKYVGLKNGENAPAIGGKELQSQQKALPKLVQLPFKVTGLAAIGIISNLVRALSKVPGAGMLAGTMNALIGPVASAFGLKSNVGQLMKGGGLQGKKREEEKKKTALAKAKAEAQVAQREQEVSGSLGYEVSSSNATSGVGPAKVGPKKVGSKKVGRGGLFGMGLMGLAQGGWIRGPQTGYPVSLDGGNSVSFIGHGTEYVATRSGGGGNKSAYVIPFDTPATRGNKNLTGRRMNEAVSAGFKFSEGGQVPEGKDGKKEGTKPGSGFANSNLTPMQIWAKNFPELAKKVKPGQSGYEEIQAYLMGQVSKQAWSAAANGLDLSKTLGIDSSKLGIVDSSKMGPPLPGGSASMSWASTLTGLDLMGSRISSTDPAFSQKFSGDARFASRDKPMGELPKNMAESARMQQMSEGGILAGAKKIVGQGAGVANQCANTVRAALRAGGHGAAGKVTSTGDLDTPKGSSYSKGAGFAASFGGSDMGTIIRDKSQIKAGDIILWKADRDLGGSSNKGAITHVGIAADDGLKNQYDHNSSRGFHYRPHWSSSGGTSWFAGVRLGGKVGEVGSSPDTGSGSGNSTGSGASGTGSGTMSIEALIGQLESQIGAARRSIGVEPAAATPSAPASPDTGKPKSLGGWIKRLAAGGIVQVSSGDSGSGWGIAGVKDAQGRPAVFTKAAAEAFQKMMKDSNGAVKGSDIASSQRSPSKNKAVGGVPNSNHLYGNALDIHGTSQTWMRKNGAKYGWMINDYPGSHGGHFDFKGAGAGQNIPQDAKDKEGPSGTSPSGTSPSGTSPSGDQPQSIEALISTLETQIGNARKSIGIGSESLGTTQPATPSSPTPVGGTKSANPSKSTPANVKPAEEPTSTSLKQTTESNGQLKAQVAAQQKQAATDYAAAQTTSVRNQAQAAAINNKIAASAAGSGGGGGVVTVPFTANKEMDDLMKYRPGFGLFAGIGGSGV